MSSHRIRDRRGDVGPEAALWLGRNRGRYSLRELGERCGGLDYATVGKALERFGQRLGREVGLGRFMKAVERQLGEPPEAQAVKSNVKT